MNSQYKDTYFLNRDFALQEALKNNKVQITKGLQATQICYYHGELLDHAPYNCINVPLENIIEYFSTTPYRIPKKLEPKGIDFASQEEANQFFNTFSTLLQESVNNRNQLEDFLYEEIKKQEPDFSDQTLRVFIFSCQRTIVMKNIATNVAKAFEEQGYEVLFFTQIQDIEECHELDRLKAHYSFNPHITFNINHLENHYLNENIFNFVWFQDVMPCLIDNSIINLRARDFIFHLTNGLNGILQTKNISSSYQPFCIDKSLFQNHHNILREDKIVFVGSSYKQAFDNLQNKEKDIILDKLINIYLNNGPLSIEEKEQIRKSTTLSGREFSSIIGYLERDIQIKQIINLNLDTPIEVYGYGFELDQDIKPFWKGPLKNIEDVSKTYNSAKYFLVSGGYIMQQRLLEGLASGSIPIVLDVRENDSYYNKKFDELMLFYSSIHDIPDLTKKEYKANSTLTEVLLNNYQYSTFINNLTEILKKSKIL